MHDGLEAEDPSAIDCDRLRLERGLRPGGLVGLEVGGKDDGKGGNYRSLPPMRSCFTMVASTSTMARTAINAVMSEMS